MDEPPDSQVSDGKKATTTCKTAIAPGEADHGRQKRVGVPAILPPLKSPPKKHQPVVNSTMPPEPPPLDNCAAIVPYQRPPPTKSEPAGPPLVNSSSQPKSVSTRNSWRLLKQDDESFIKSLARSSGEKTMTLYQKPVPEMSRDLVPSTSQPPQSQQYGYPSIQHSITDNNHYCSDATTGGLADPRSRRDRSMHSSPFSATTSNGRSNMAKELEELVALGELLQSQSEKGELIVRRPQGDLGCDSRLLNSSRLIRLQVRMEMKVRGPVDWVIMTMHDHSPSCSTLTVVYHYILTQSREITSRRAGEGGVGVGAKVSGV